MIVLSLFDGMSCGRVALERAGLPVTKYYASEIDKYAIEISKKNYPNIVHLGDVTTWKEWNIERPNLIIAGSPCQGFSNAGKGLNFDDPRSRLYFVFEEILQYYKPEFWLLENVKMKREWRDLITERLGVEPILINSALVSAQNRERYYWCNFPTKQPEDRHIYLKDIVLDNTVPVALHNLYGGFKEKSVRVFEEKSPTIRTSAGGGHIPSSAVKDNIFEILPLRVVGRRLSEDGKRDDYNKDIDSVQMVEITDKEKAHSLTTVAKDSMIVNIDLLKEKILEAMNEEGKNIVIKTHKKRITGNVREKASALSASDWRGLNRNQQQNAVLNLEELYHSEKAIEYMNRERRDGRTGWDFAHHSDIRNKKSAAVVANFFKGVPYNVFKDWNVIRKFHPIECERLQTLPDNYTEGVSNTQRYKMIGNGWTVDVVGHLLDYINEEIALMKWIGND